MLANATERERTALPHSTPFAMLPATVLPQCVVQPRLGVWLRGGLILGGCSLGLVLLVAVWLSPSLRGLGTHQQLGLPPCSLRVWAGMRCPSCGMTTAWAYMVRGRVVESFHSNCGGALLALLAILLAPWMFLSGVRGTWFGGVPHEWTFAWCAVGIMLVTLVDWGVRIYNGQIFQ